MSVEETRSNILDSAEALFAEWGYHATSLRQITDLAGANVASVNYHFGGKEKLLYAVLKRLLEPLNRERLSRLKDLEEACDRNGEPLSVREVYRCFLEPTMGAMHSSEGEHLALIMGRILTEFKGVMMGHVASILQPLLESYINAFCRAVPQRSREEVTLRFRMSMGAMLHAIHTMRANVTEDIPPELQCVVESQVIIDTLIDYVTRAMEV
ncbi:MAG: TetR/AcrR family transcriptional regulator [Desulfobacterales bacterium]|nr:TetR/AcrR family transcriptional regulator [Desulfobacterales bacterium]